MNDIVAVLSKKSKISESKIYELLEEISMTLIKEGCNSTDPRFLPYLMRRVRKRLKIQESNIYKTFKDFFKE